MKVRFVFFPTLFIFIWNISLAQQGLKGEYFNGRNFDSRVLTRTDAQINFNWDRKPPAKGMESTDFSIRWTGRLLAELSGTYTFSAVVDDGLRLWVGGVKVIDAWGPHDHENVNGDVVLTAGQLYELKIEYFNGMLEGQIQLNWKTPTEEKSMLGWFGGNAKPIDPKLLFPPKVPVAQAIATESEQKPEIKTVPKPEPPKVNNAILPPPPPKVPATTVAAKMKDTIFKYTPKNILFEPGEPFILPQSYPELNQLVKLLKRFSKLRIRIEGHTDITGDPKINQTLSEDRANEVAYYLQENGIEVTRIRTKGFGASKPLFGKDSTKMYPQNRRVEFVIE